MFFRLLLIGFPVALIAILLQAGFWVPGYDNQGERSPQRLQQLIQASSGDARLLNPVLSADSSSSRITGLVFDGLLKIDDALSLAPSLATRYELGERAYLMNPSSVDTLDEQVARIETELPRRLAQREGTPVRLLSVEIQAAHSEQRNLEGDGPDNAYTIHWPKRIALTLSDVVAELDTLLPTSGVARTLREALVADGPTEPTQLSDDALDDLVPTLERNPTIRFWLRDDVSFHDGHPLDANDVAFTVAAILDPRNRSPRRSDFEPIKAVEVLDLHTLQVTYKRLFAPAINAWTMGILPEHLLTTQAIRSEGLARGLDEEALDALSIRDSAQMRAPIGTGAYTFNEWRSDEFIHLQANPNYFDGPPRSEEFFFRIMPDPLTREIEFRAGALDSYQAQPHQAARYREDARFHSLSTTRPGYTYVGYNLRREPFSDPRFRRALGMAIDTEAIIRYVMFDEGERITGPYSSITPWYDHGVPTLPHAPEKAAKLLAEMGYKRGEDGMLWKDGKPLSITLITNNGNPQRKTITTILQREWQRLGIRCNVQLFEWAVFLKDFINPGAFDAVVLGWLTGIDPDLYQVWHSSQTGPSQLNFVGFKDQETDRLIESIRREYDPKRQQRMAHALHRRIAHLQPYTFLFAPRSTRVLDRKLVYGSAWRRAASHSSWRRWRCVLPHAALEKAEPCALI